MNELKPCPFCGGEKQSVIRKSVLVGWNGLDERVDYNRWYVRCNLCFARGGTAGGKILHSTHFDMKMPEWATTDDNLRDIAIRNWNDRRADDV